MLKIENLSKTYKSRQVVQDVSLEVQSGEIIGLLGPNGAGKTTSFYMIVGLVRSEGGSIFLGTEDLTRFPIDVRARKGLGYLPQESSIFRRMTVEQNICTQLGHLPAPSPDARIVFMIARNEKDSIFGLK